MPDVEFRRMVVAAQGIVMIGLKDPFASEGVDDSGSVLISSLGFDAAKDAMRLAGLQIVHEFVRTPVVVADVLPDVAVALRENPYVDYMEPAVPGNFFSQVVPWGVTSVKADSSWSLSTGDGVKLLVLDSGVDSVATDLSVPLAWRCISGPVSDQLGHGTFVAGVVAALDNSQGVVGVSPDVTLASANVEVSGAPSPAETACSLDVARVNNIDVVNMSLGFSTPYTAITDAINGGYNNDDMIFVAAVGNSGGSVAFPAVLANVIGVTAVDSMNAHPGWANTGSAVNISAPGVDVLSLSLPGGSVCSTGGATAVCDGTSFAAPHVSGAAAMLRARYPGWSNSTIRTRLENTATDLGSIGVDNTFGHGLLNIERALGVSVVVLGPPVAYSGYSTMWSAGVSGGQAPFSYQWHINGSPAGTSSTVSFTPGGSDFWVKLVATDAYSVSSADSMFVTVSGCTPPEIVC